MRHRSLAASPDLRSSSLFSETGRLLTRGLPRKRNVCTLASSGSSERRLTVEDLKHLKEAARVADSTAGLTQPHPNAGCILVGPSGRVLASTYQRAQGTMSAELQAVQLAGEAARGATAYLNLETGDCHGDSAALKALVSSGVSRVVLGMQHPLQHLRGTAVKALRSNGVQVDLLGEVPVLGEQSDAAEALRACLQVNEALLHRAVLRRPLSILKYAMTLDGKIATQTGHSAWVTSPPARALVFEQRGRSDAVIVGGNTVRRDNPRLTTRKEAPCHLPVRVVMSRTLELPENADLWDVGVAPTIVMTQKGARAGFQAKLRGRGVEVVEFDFLTPEAVAEYCYDRGWLQCFWECGGTLAAPCISGGVIHKVMAFVAPKIIGGARAPTPVGELGFVEMTQAVDILKSEWKQVGPDLLVTGFLPTSGGAEALEAVLSQPATASSRPTVVTSTSTATATASTSTTPASSATPGSSSATTSTSGTAAAATPQRGTATKAGPQGPVSKLPGSHRRRKLAQFYKAWDEWGALSNFSPHPFVLTDDGKSTPREWRSVEHYYQAQKFGPGPEGSEEGADSYSAAAAVLESIAAAESPEEAARIGRLVERTNPMLLRPDWGEAKLDVMYRALRAKFTTHEGPRAMLLASVGMELVEASPHDFFWGHGYDGSGSNHLGRLLMRLRDELLAEQQQQQ